MTCRPSLRGTPLPARLLVAAIAVAVAVPLTSRASFAGEEPEECVHLGQQLEAALKAKPPAPADKAKVAALRRKGRTECAAEHDEAATADLQAGLKLLGQ